jgi:TusA-related sulfurtransferase
MIVKAALNHCKSGDSVTVFANDTDVIVMLLYFWKKEMGQVVIRSSYTKNGRSQIKQLDMETAMDSLDSSIVPYSLFIQAF